jgi:hypothetical protein
LRHIIQKKIKVTSLNLNILKIAAKWANLEVHNATFPEMYTRYSKKYVYHGLWHRIELVEEKFYLIGSCIVIVNFSIGFLILFENLLVAGISIPLHTIGSPVKNKHNFHSIYLASSLVYRSEGVYDVKKDIDLI